MFKKPGINVKQTGNGGKTKSAVDTSALFCYNVCVKNAPVAQQDRASAS